MVFHLLADRKYQLERRDGLMVAARECRAALIDPNGWFRYHPDDQRVKAAVKIWVDKARHAHAVAMGRTPVIKNLLYIGNERIGKFDLYTH